MIDNDRRVNILKAILLVNQLTGTTSIKILTPGALSKSLSSPAQFYDIPVMIYTIDRRIFPA
jgi:hypothetical protein